MTKSCQQQLQFHTSGRGSANITAEVAAVAAGSGVDCGLCHVFLHHTSASLMLCENADPAVRADLDAFMLRLVPDGDPLFSHVDEGPDDMAAPVRAVLGGMQLTLPVTGGRLGLGTWQGVYLWEHRHHPHLRRVTVTVQG
jgi:secondary thiamine-phosphate synthase enzyme